MPRSAWSHSRAKQSSMLLPALAGRRVMPPAPVPTSPPSTSRPSSSAAARELSAHLRPPIDFRLADAERLPFADAQFDAVISTFGVMFAADQAQAARELGRVCRPGGRLVLTSWAPDGAVAAFFTLLGRYAVTPPPPSSPLAWGNPDACRTAARTLFRAYFRARRQQRLSRQRGCHLGVVCPWLRPIAPAARPAGPKPAGGAAPGGRGLPPSLCDRCRPPCQARVSVHCWSPPVEVRCVSWRQIYSLNRIGANLNFGGRDEKIGESKLDQVLPERNSSARATMSAFMRSLASAC